VPLPLRSNRDSHAIAFAPLAGAASGTAYLEGHGVLAKSDGGDLGVGNADCWCGAGIVISAL